MKAPSALFAVSILLAAPLHGQEEKPAPPAEAAPSGEAAPAPAPAPAPEAAPASEPAEKAAEAPANPPAFRSEKGVEPLPTLPDAPAAGEPTLIPETPAPMEKPAGSALPSEPTADNKEKGKEKKSKTEAAEAELQERIRYREARARALGDAGVQAEFKQAEKARTEYARREALKRYYTKLYDLMDKFEPTLKKTIASHRLISTRRLEQTRIAPTEPFEPGERIVNRAVGGVIPEE